ncbi:MAG: hypothetical protein AB7O04_01825 [Hyphomonadaceae bacterium]
MEEGLALIIGVTSALATLGAALIATIMRYRSAPPTGDVRLREALERENAELKRIEVLERENAQLRERLANSPH